MTIRPATTADLPAVIALEQATPTAAHWSPADYQRVFSSGGGPSRVALVADESGQLRGFLVARRVDREWEIENVAVGAAWQRRGLGSQLVGVVVQLAREAGADRLFLEVRESNQMARRLYEKWAFVQAGRRKSYYSNPIEDALVYQLTLGAS